MGLHDALSRTLLDPMIEAATDRGLPVSGIMTDVIDYHADVTLLPARAAEAGIKRLALYHLVPVPNALTERMFLRGLPGGKPRSVQVRREEARGAHREVPRPADHRNGEGEAGRSEVAVAANFRIRPRGGFGS